MEMDDSDNPVAFERWRTCDRKKQFEKKSAANRAAKKLGTGGRSYKCPFCGAYHITSQQLK